MATYAECLAAVHQVLDPYNPSGETVSEDTAIMADLGISSLQMLEIIAEIEDVLDVSLPLNQLPNIRTVREFTRMLTNVTELPES
jgi:acyl carrier protein